MDNSSKDRTGVNDVRWVLTDLFSGIDDPKIDLTIKEAKEKANIFISKYKGKLNSLSLDKIESAYVELEDLLSPLYRLSQYTYLSYATDTSNNSIKQLRARVDEEIAYISNSIVFFNIELGMLPKDRINKFSSFSDKYKYRLKRTWDTAKYNLSEKEEQIINLKDLSGVKAFRKLYSELTSSFRFEFELDGETKIMNNSELRALRQHPNSDIRRRAMKLFFSKYKENKLILSHIYNNIVKNHSIELGLRSYPSAISMMNINNDLEDLSVDVLHEVTTESYKLVSRYYKLKASMLSLDDMTLADIYAPMPESQQFYSWDSAKDIVLEGFSDFDDDFYKMAKAMFDNNRIDAPVSHGKKGGAFCYGSTPGLKPYVMLNFLGKQQDIFTLAHELGHAIHDFFSAKQTLLSYHPILPLAETASVFSEMLITDLLLKKESDPITKKAILTDKLESIFATSHRQNMFSRFEISAHKTISKRLMSWEELCELYKSELNMMFGGSVRYTDEYYWEWASIPHIYDVPFYVYAYNFGNLLVMALYQKYLEDGKFFISKYKEFLSMGSSASPFHIAKIVGVNINSKSFWEKSLLYIEKLIFDLERLVQ